MNYLPTSASFLITETCNLRCKYCFEQFRYNKSISDEVIERGVDLLFNNAIKSNQRNISISIFGGEPTLYPKKIEKVLEYSLYKQNETGIEAQLGIITNGVSLTEELQDILNNYKDKLNLGVQLSVDGNEKVQNMYRVTANKTGSFKLIEKNIPIYKEIFTNNPQQLSIHGCLNKGTLPYLAESYKFFKDIWGFERIWFMPVHEEQWDSNDVKIYREQLTKIANYILNDMIKNNRINDLKNFSPFNKLFDGRSFVNPPCNAGKTYISITSNGDIYPCHHFYFNDNKKEMLLGNVWEGIINEEVRKPFIELDNGQMSCPSKCECYNCYRCLGANWATNGDIKKQIQGHYCEMAHIEHEICEYMKEKAQELSLMQNNNIQYSKDEGMEILAKAIKVLLIEMEEIKNAQKQIVELLKSR